MRLRSSFALWLLIFAPAVLRAQSLAVRPPAVVVNRTAEAWPDPVDRHRYKVVGAVAGAVVGMVAALPADRKTAASGGMIPLWPVTAALGGSLGWWLGGVVYDRRVP